MKLAEETLIKLIRDAIEIGWSFEDCKNRSVWFASALNYFTEEEIKNCFEELSK